MTLTRWASKGNIFSMTFALPYLVFGALLCSFALAVIADRRSSHKLAQLDWHDLVAALQRLDMAEVSAVAIDYLTPHRGQIDMEPQQIWESLGGYEGLKRMRQNAEIMLALAAYAQQWNFEEAVIVTERMRMDAASLRRAVRRVKLGMLPTQLASRFRFTLPLHAQEASSAYYLMRQRLLALYETSHICRYPALAAAL
jgi:Xaa-Pro aminopeptidase